MIIHRYAMMRATPENVRKIPLSLAHRSMRAHCSSCGEEMIGDQVGFEEALQLCHEARQDPPRICLDSYAAAPDPKEVRVYMFDADIASEFHPRDN